MLRYSTNTKLFCLSVALSVLSILTVLQEIAVAGKLDAAICDQADLVTGDYQAVEELMAGANGFMVAVTSSYEESVLINLSWEALQDKEDSSSKQLLSDMLVLGMKQKSLSLSRHLTVV